MKPGAPAVHGTITSKINPVLDETESSGESLTQYHNIIFVTLAFFN